MNLLNVDALTLNAVEATELSKFIFSTLLETGDLAKYHDIQTGIFYKEQIPFVGTLGLVGKKSTGCTPKTNDGTVTFTEKFWTPEMIEDRFKNCAKDANRLFKAFKRKQKINPEFFNNIGSEEEGVIFTLIEGALRTMINRKIWFDDRTIRNVSAGGYLKNEIDADYFNVIDGLWKQIISIDIPVGSKNHIQITQNSAATYVLQDALPNDFAIKLFRDMWNQSDSRLKQAIAGGEKLNLHVTPRIAQNWADYKEDKSLVFTLGNAENGGLLDLYRNIEIVTRYDWESSIEAYFDNGTKYHLPHRALMTVPTNIPIGTVSLEDLKNLESFYDPLGKQNVTDFAFMLDAKFLQPFMAVAAY
ncbi:hypothetical protein [Flavobacterium psychrophilum]|uniref:hypothetical protein n=1 Tax=Flavobacterium psychrophilum TaxID=96345 RepID=UPI000B7C4714|nr:hypothetical protein [Flavobacterium psychrophilum]SNA77319.1 hypothetical protein FI070_30132 [Flavobacterium psychrophilum]